MWADARGIGGLAVDANKGLRAGEAQQEPTAVLQIVLVAVIGEDFGDPQAQDGLRSGRVQSA